MKWFRVCNFIWSRQCVYYVLCCLNKSWTAISITHLAIHNGTTDCEEFSRGIQNQNDFGLSVNIFKEISNIFWNDMVPRKQKLCLFLMNTLFFIRGLFEKKSITKIYQCCKKPPQPYKVTTSYIQCFENEEFFYGILTLKIVQIAASVQLG